MIEQIEQNDSGFSKIWSKAKNLECGTLFLNSKLTDDLFFNKLTNITCLNEKMIDIVVEQSRMANSKPYVYALNFPDLEALLKKKKFIYYDTQHALYKKKSSQTSVNAKKISMENRNLWTKIFCEAYDCFNWEETVNSIIQKSLSFVEYFVDESNSSCMALYEKNSILGLYCLGTIPDKRKQGFAESLINFALYEVKKRKNKFLMLETFEKDNLLNFYSKLGFEKIYQKGIYTI